MSKKIPDCAPQWIKDAVDSAKNVEGNTPVQTSRDRQDIDWAVEQRVQQALSARRSYVNGMYDGVLYTIVALVMVFILVWPEIKKRAVA